ncbi:MAG: sialidase family protein [Chloroflexota bacterium]
MYWHEVKYQPERSQAFLGSPSILRLADGALLATHDYFGPGCPRNHENEESLTSVYRSEDNGIQWRNITHVMNAYWSSLFWHRGAAYLFGVSQQYGSIVIRRSDDGGYTWTHPADETSGLLFRGGPFREPPNYHCAPVPILFHKGRLYRAFEDCTPPHWGTGFQACVLSAPIDVDLLDARNWRMSNKLPFDPQWLPDDWPKLEKPGWLEGNIVLSPDQTLRNILRFNSKPLVEKAAVLTIVDEGRHIAFDPQIGFVDFPGGMSKFTIRYDEVSELYLTLTNNNTDPDYPNQRNVLSLYASPDLTTWQHVSTLLSDQSGLLPDDSMRLTGFQYVDWQFDGDDLIYLVRAAYRGARNYHDANRIVFQVLPKFRGLLTKKYV